MKVTNIAGALLRMAVPVLAASVLAAQTRLSVQSADPTALRLEKGGTATVTLQGTGLGAITSVALIEEGKMAVSGVSAALVSLPAPPAATRQLESRTVKLSAMWSAPEGGGYRLQVRAGEQATLLPESMLQVAVVWPQPRVSSCPAAAPVNSVISIGGSGFGYLGERDKTKVALSYSGTYDRSPVYAEIVSLSPTEVRVRVPNGARRVKPAVVTPGGCGYAPANFDPQYIQHLSPDAFKPTGDLGSLFHISECRFVFANGTDNSAFIPSNAMSALGFGRTLFTFPPRDQRIDLAVASTIFRVRLKGSNRLNASESLQTTAFGVDINGTDILINLAFESDGTEFIGEYETRDVLSGKIYWKHCLDLEDDALKVAVTLPVSTTRTFLRYSFVSFGEVQAGASFVPRFSILGSPPFRIDEGPIKDYIKSEAERSIYNALNSEGFKSLLNSALTAYVRRLFEGMPVVTVQAQKAGDGGLDFVGRTY